MHYTKDTDGNICTLYLAQPFLRSEAAGYFQIY